VHIPELNFAADVEWSVLLAACSAIAPEEKNRRLVPLLKRPIQWPVLFSRAEQHGLSPLLYQALFGMPDIVPFESLRQLKKRYQSNIHKSLFLTRELIRILDEFDSLAIEVLPYKGVTLAETVYGDVALRQSGDIDLLIRPRDVKRAKDALSKLGYTPQLSFSPREEDAYLISGYETTFDSPLGRNLLELQWALQPSFYAVDADMEEFFNRAVTMSVGGRSMKMLTAEDLFVILSVHAAKHVWARLVWLCDIARVMTSTSLDWDRVFAKSETLGIKRIALLTLLLANQFFESAVPARAEKELLQDPEASPLAKMIQSKIVDGTASDVESISYFRLMMRLRERRADRVRFLYRLVFTPGPNEWRAIRLPAPLFPFYRLVRLSRLAARLIRA